MEQTEVTAAKEILRDCDMVLLGIGDQLSKEKAPREEILRAYDCLAGLVEGKPWFAVTLNTDDLIYESKLNRFFIVAPCGSEASGNVVTNEDYDESAYLPQWQFYRNWISATLGKKLCMLELGAGMAYPSIVRMPFERMAQVNQKARLIRVHSKLAQVPGELADRSVCVAEKPIEFLMKLTEND